MKGWLEKYNDGGPVQPNYNDYSVSAGPGFQGDGYSNVGRNYSPAWGGQFQNGGKVKPITVTDKNDPRLKAYQDSLYVRNKYSQSFGPGSKTRPLTKKEKEFWKDEKTGLLPNLVEYSPKSGKDEGYFGHFKKPTQPVIYQKPEPTPQSTIDFMEGNYAQGPITEIPQPQASAYGEVVDPRTGYTHMTRQGSPMYPMVGQNVPEMAMGGSIGGATQGIPGATGFMYARVAGSTPSKGKGRNKVYKTDASAQNGKEMKFYQEGLDFKPKSISKNGSVIKDDRGQWDHPGEITEIGSNQITMQGVPYPVMGVSDTGDTQMMYPNQEYQYNGNSVTEYPMMQDGGVLDSIVNVGKGVVNYFDNLVKTGIDKLSSYDDPKPTTSNTYKKQPDLSHTPDVFDEFITSGQYGGEAWTNFIQKTESNDKADYTSDKNRIKLNTGRFKGANVSSKLIDDLAEAAKRNNIPVGQLLTLAGRESTFGEDQSNKINMGGRSGYTSAWDVAKDYQPYDPNRFLADNKVPGIQVIKNSAGWGYDIVDVNTAREYVNSHPELLKKYKDKLAKTPDIGNKNYFDLSAEFLKKKGIKGYNPGDPNYEKMFNQDYDILKQDKALMSYLKKKGYKYEQGGQLTKLDQLTNFTNYNTKQPGGWLDKYQ